MNAIGTGAVRHVKSSGRFAGEIFESFIGVFGSLIQQNRAAIESMLRIYHYIGTGLDVEFGFGPADAVGAGSVTGGMRSRPGVPQFEELVGGVVAYPSTEGCGIHSIPLFFTGLAMFNHRVLAAILGLVEGALQRGFGNKEIVNKELTPHYGAEICDFKQFPTPRKLLETIH